MKVKIIGCCEECWLWKQGVIVSSCFTAGIIQEQLLRNAASNHFTYLVYVTKQAGCAFPKHCNPIPFCEKEIIPLISLKELNKYVQ